MFTVKIIVYDESDTEIVESEFAYKEERDALQASQDACLCLEKLGDAIREE